MPQATVIKFAPRPRTTLRDLCAPSREDDEKLLRVIAKLEDCGVTVAFEGDAPTREDGDEPACALSASREALSSPNPFVSPYLLQPLRTEAEVRAARSPRIAPAKGLAQCIAECTGIDAAFRKLIGG
jgi:hypothetical protein